MRLVEYTPDLFPALRAAAERLGVASLRHRPFVDHYFCGNPWCKLHLLTDAEGAVAGMIGVDAMRFEAGGRSLTLGFATSFHAAQPGAGGYLYLHWMKTAPLGLVFGGSEDTHRILRHQGWTYFPGVQTFALNRAYAARHGESTWRRLAKRVLTRFRQPPAVRFAGRVPAAAAARVAAEEVDHVTADMPPRTSPFALRFAPDLDYLNWRYRTGLSFVYYRVFRLRTDGRPSGYVVLNDAPDRVVVAHCDGEAPADLAHGVLRSVVIATKEDRKIREVVLASSCPEMGRIYRRFGFRAVGAERPFAVGSRRGPVGLPADPSRWLVNHGWGDNDLRAPFLDQSAPGSARRRRRPLRRGIDRGEGPTMTHCKTLVKKGLMASGLLALAQRLHGPRVVVLRYHSVRERPADCEHSIGRGIVHAAAAFREQMEWLARAYEPVGLEDVAASLERRRPMPRRGVLVTFDDGYADNFDTAAPVLDRLGMKAAFYITVDCIEPQKMPWFCRLRHAFAATARETWKDPLGEREWRLTDAAERRRAFLSASETCARRSGPAQEERIGAIEHGLGVERLAPPERLMMDWGQIRELRRRGHAVGSHTVTHPNLAQVRPDEAARELRESRRLLEEKLGAPVHHFSYPSPILEPHWSACTTAGCEEAGYRTAVTCTPGPVLAGDSALCLKRIAAPEKLEEFQWAVRCAFLGRCV